jgi:hypothetical protein
MFIRLKLNDYKYGPEYVKVIILIRISHFIDNFDGFMIFQRLNFTSVPLSMPGPNRQATAPPLKKGAGGTGI